MYNVICVKWGNKFSADYVNRLSAMVSKNLTLPYKFFCLTEDSSGLNSNIKALPLSRPDLEYCWNKLLVFEKDLPLDGKVIFLDLDVVITGNIDFLFTTSPEKSFLGLMDWNRPYTFNTSVYRLEVGKFPHVIEEFYEGIQNGWLEKTREWDSTLKSNDKVVYWDSRPASKQFLDGMNSKWKQENYVSNRVRYPGDQEWTSNRLFANKDLPANSFPENLILSYKKHGKRTLPDNCRIMVFHGDPKPHQVDLWYVKEYWHVDK
jgi:hypothetical protein